MDLLDECRQAGEEGESLLEDIRFRAALAVAAEVAVLGDVHKVEGVPLLQHIGEGVRGGEEPQSSQPDCGGDGE